MSANRIPTCDEVIEVGIWGQDANLDDPHAVEKDAREYVEQRWDKIVEDVARLVRVESTEALGEATESAPFGPGPRAALDEALSLAGEMALDTHDCEGRIGYADLPGASDVQVGVIGHVDVVPAGPGWTVQPFDVTRREGYLMGRGVADDKGPLVIALHAVNFWRERLAARGLVFPYSIRVLFGANEETNMNDVAYYRAHYEDPAFLFTPDAEFPVCYGEAGICSGTLTFKRAASADEAGIVDLVGGVAVNAVPGEADARIRLRDGMAAPSSTSAVSVSACENGEVALHATGKSAHASTPDQGINAIGVLARFLLDNDLCADGEREFVALLARACDSPDGSAFGVACSDDAFGALTSVLGMVRTTRDPKTGDLTFSQSIDFRYPTCTTSSEIEQAVREAVASCGASFAMGHDKEPFTMGADSPAIEALLSAYNQVTGESAQPFTMKGGTYARMFSRAASFGPEKPWESKPDWAGSMHGPDEAIAEDLLKEAFVVYAVAIGKLMEVQL